VGHVGAKALFDARDRVFRVFDGVVEKRGGQSGSVKAHVREDMRHFQEMSKVGIAGAPELVMMALGGNFVGAPHHPGIFEGRLMRSFSSSSSRRASSWRAARSRLNWSGRLLGEGMIQAGLTVPV